MTAAPFPQDTNQLITGILNIVTGGLSLIACVWIFHFYSKTYQPRPVSLKLILALSIADFFFSLANIISVFDQDNHPLCTFEALMRASSVISGMYWASCIAVLTYQTFSKGKNFDQAAFFKNSLVIGCVLPIVFSIIPLLSGGYLTYGPQTFGCYISLSSKIEPTHVNRFMIMMFFDGIPVIISLTVTLVVYLLVAKKLHELSQHLLLTVDIEIRRLFWYPGVFFLSYVPSFIDNIIEIYIASASASLAFTVVHIVLTHSVGLTNALVYGLQRKKYYEIYEKPNSSRHASIDQQTSCDGHQEDGDYQNEAELRHSDDEDISRPRMNSAYDELIQARSNDYGF